MADGGTETSVSKAHLDEVVGGFDTKINDIDVKMTEKVTSVMLTEMRKMLEEFSSKTASKDDLPSSQDNLDKGGNTLSTEVDSANAKARAAAEAKKVEDGKSPTSSGASGV